MRLPLELLFLAQLACARVITSQQHLLVERNEEGLAPGVGIHFSTSYATAAVRFENGTIRDLARVEADTDYIDLMARWTGGPRPAKHKKTDGNTERRSALDVEVLSAHFRRVKDAIESSLGFDVQIAYSAFPQLPNLNATNIQSALDHVGLSSLAPHIVDFEANTAYAALGYGLCENWRDQARCQQEEAQMRPERALFVKFDNSSFSVLSQMMQSPHSTRPESYALAADLGWWDLPVVEFPKEREWFWERVNDAIAHVVGYVARVPNKIVLLGDHADEEEFRDVVKAAVWEAIEYDAQMLLEGNDGVDKGMLVARGAAELAFRAQYRVGSRTEGANEPETVLEL